MVWASIGYNFKTPLYVIPLVPWHIYEGVVYPAKTLTAQRYADLIIDDVLLDTHMRTGFSVVEDNAKPHTGLVARERRERRAIPTQAHPTQSLDLNAIENIWWILKNKLSHWSLMPHDVNELSRVAKDVWNTEAMLEHVNAVIESMEKCVKLIVTKHGGPLKY